MIGATFRRRPGALRAAALLAAAPLAGCHGAAPAAPPLVAFLGDSLTAGWGLSENEAYPALVGRALQESGRPVRVLNAGRSGDTVAQGLGRLAGVLEAGPDVLVVALGVNDALRGLPAGPAERALREIVARARGAGVHVVLVGFRVPRESPGLQAYEQLYVRIAAGERLAFVPDLLDGVTGRPELLFADGLHPNAAGQQRLARNVRRPVELVLAEIERRTAE